MKNLYKMAFLLATIFISQFALAQCNGSIFAFGNLNQNQYNFSFQFPLVASYSYIWDYGDGTSDSGNSAAIGVTTHQYPDDGTYVVTVIYSDNTNGCVAYDTIIVNGPCDTHFSMVDTNNQIICSADTIASTYTRYWHFSTGGYSINTQTHAFPYYATGDFVGTLQVRDTINNCYSASLDTIQVVYAPQPNQIVGRPRMVTWIPQYGTAYLIVHDSVTGTLTAIDSMLFTPSTFPYFKFESITSGDYLIKFALDAADTYYSTTLPTYFKNPISGSPSGTLIWSDADYITIPNTNGNTIFDMEMVTGTNPGGPGFVGGLISQGANKVGDPLPNVNVIIFDDNGNPVDYGLSNDQGEFLIDSLPFGTYSIYPEVAGKTTNPISITISAADLGTKMIKVEVNSTTVDVSIINGINNLEDTQAIQVYPNPVKNTLRINFGETVTGTIDIILLDVLGKVVLTAYENNTKEILLNTSLLKTGIYILKIRTDKGERSFKITK